MPRSVLGFVLALYVVSVLTCALTRDFGFYFDDKYYVESLRVTFESGVPLPKRYHYPSLGYAISLIAALPSLAAHGFDGQALAAQLAAALGQGLVPQPGLVLDARVVFAAVSYLALFWVALLAWRASHSRLAAVAAALALALSFEFHYHARQWAPDAPMAQFACLSVLFAQRYASGRALKHLVWSAVAAGLAAGTKFPGALALGSIGVAILWVEFGAAADGERRRAWLRSVRLGLFALLLLLAVFVATTPGVIFDWGLVHKGVSVELRHYQGEGMAGAHRPYDVDAGLDHLQRLGVYLSSQAFSYQPWVAAVMFALAVVGWAWVLRRDWRLGAVLLVLPALYVPYFGFQRLLLVRNLQVLLPFLALGFGLGVHALHAGGGARLARRIGLVAVALALVWNTWFLVRADATVLRRASLDIPAAIERWVEASPQPVFLAPSARALVEARVASWQSSGKLVDDSTQAHETLIVPADFARMLGRADLSRDRVRANQPWVYRPLPEGPWEINFSYYPTWGGDERPLVIDSSYYRELEGL